MLDFQRFDPAVCGFSRPAVPLLPALDWSALSFASEQAALSTTGGARHFARGRYALHAAYRAAGAGPAGSVLIPAYHCRTMLDPAFALGAPVALYALDASLQPDLCDIRRLLMAQTVRALVLTHYFGVEQHPALLGDLSALCVAHGATLIEDCSHAWQVAAKRAAGGDLAGRMVVASPYKFFPCEDGGVLWSAPAVPFPVRPGLLREAKAVKSAWDRRRAARRALPAAAALADNGLRGTDIVERSGQPSPQYERACEQRASLALSRWVMRHTRLAPLMARRREHYRQWAAAVAGLSGARPLFAQLPDDCAPYMFPLLITQPDPVFYVLKQAGMPIWRWDDMASSACLVAMHYRTHLLHLPCHQGLSARQMAWMTSMVAKVCA